MRLNALAGSFQYIWFDPPGSGIPVRTGCLLPTWESFADSPACRRKKWPEDPVANVNRFSKECGAVVLLKGAPTCVGLPDGTTYVCPSGNAGMATAGSGDVLTGLIAGLIAQGMSCR